MSLLGFVLFFSHIKYGSGLEFYANQILIWLIYVFLHLYFGFRELCTKLYSMSWGNTQSDMSVAFISSTHGEDGKIGIDFKIMQHRQCGVDLCHGNNQAGEIKVGKY